MKQMDRLSGTERNAADDLFVAFIACGWELMRPVDEALAVAERIAFIDPKAAWKLSGQLMRGETMSEDVKRFMQSCRAIRSAEGDGG